MARTISFAAAAALLSLAAACGDNNDDETRVIRPGADAPEPVEQLSDSAGADEEKPAASQARVPTPARSGPQVFAKHCAPCHAAGDEHPGAMQLGVTRGPEYAVLEERSDLTADYVKLIVRNGLNGMPPFTPTVVTDDELDALALYLSGEEG